MKRYILLLALATMNTLFSCSKNEIHEYVGEDRVYFYERYFYLGYDERRTLELNYSFAVVSESITEDNLNIKVRLQGRVSDVDREVAVEVVKDSTTAVDGFHYRLNKGVIKANQYDGVVPLTVLKNPQWDGRVVMVKLKITDSKDLSLGAEEDAYIKVNIGNILLRPNDWPYAFGDYATNKYRFVIDVLGITNFPMANRYQTEPIPGIYTQAELFGFAYQLKDAYEKYRIEKGPIYMDDNAEVKVEISF